MTSFSVNQIILTYGWEKMPRNQVTKDELVVRVLKLKNKVDQIHPLCGRERRTSLINT